ncbi:MAG: sensor histidine kinase [Nocardioides sp.]
MRVVRNPAAQFLAAGFLLLAVVLVASGRLSERAASREAIDRAVATTELLARSVTEPALPRGLVDGDAGAVDRLDRVVLDRLLVEDVARIKIWDRSGTIVYSDETQLIGSSYALGKDELTVLRGGGVDAEESDLSKPENRFETDPTGLLEVYTRITSPEGEPLLFEVYYSAADIEARSESVLASFRPIVVGGVLALAAVATPLIWVLTRRLARAASDRERLLTAAVDASDAERRRIARDLHDTVVQDLTGTAFALSASARDGGATPDSLEAMATSMRGSLRSLRSLLVEIHPPDLRTAGVAAALEDLVAPAAGVGVTARVTVGELPDLPEGDVALVWRVAQEAVRNSLRHAEATELSVEVRTEGPLVVLEVVDDGRGFDPAEAHDRTHFGLRGLESLIAESGGTLRVTSAPGAGTAVRLEVRR